METTELTAPSLPPNLAQMCFSFAFGRAKEEDKHTITQPLHLAGLVGILPGTKSHPKPTRWISLHFIQREAWLKS
jgi:hypothetical protein